MTILRILGCDVSLARTGLAVLEADIARPEQGKVVRTAVIETKQRDSRQQRLHSIYTQMMDFLEQYPEWHMLSVAYVEKPGGWARGKQHSSQVTVEALAQARAAVLLALAWSGVVAEEITTNISKGAVAGPVSKKETILEQLQKLGLYTGSDLDISDAVCIALAGAGLEHKKVVMAPTRVRRSTKGYGEL